MQHACGAFVRYTSPGLSTRLHLCRSLDAGLLSCASLATTLWYLMHGSNPLAIRANVVLTLIQGTEPQDIPDSRHAVA